MRKAVGTRKSIGRVQEPLAWHNLGLFAAALIGSEVEQRSLTDCHLLLLAFIFNTRSPITTSLHSLPSSCQSRERPSNTRVYSPWPLFAQLRAWSRLLGRLSDLPLLRDPMPQLPRAQSTIRLPADPLRLLLRPPPWRSRLLAKMQRSRLSRSTDGTQTNQPQSLGCRHTHWI